MFVSLADLFKLCRQNLDCQIISRFYVFSHKLVSNRKFICHISCLNFRVSDIQCSCMNNCMYSTTFYLTCEVCYFVLGIQRFESYSINKYFKLNKLCTLKAATIQPFWHFCLSARIDLKAYTGHVYRLSRTLNYSMNRNNKVKHKYCLQKLVFLKARYFGLFCSEV